MAERPTLESQLRTAPRAGFRERLRNELEKEATMKTGVPEGFTTITPSLIVKDVDRLVAFLTSAFGASETDRTTTPRGVHVNVKLGTSMLYAGGPAGQGEERPSLLHLYVPDTDAAYTRARAAGGVPVSAPEDKPYGERSAEVRDPEGNTWYIATRLANSPQPEGLPSVLPYLCTQSALGLIDFLKRALGAREQAVYRHADGSLMHALLWLGDGALEFGEAPPDFPKLPSAFYLYVPDADALYRQAVEAGAKGLYPPEDRFYGDRMGAVEDPWGYTWYIATHLPRASR